MIPSLHAFSVPSDVRPFFVLVQAVTSAGSGAMAALDAERYLSEHA